MEEEKNRIICSAYLWQWRDNLDELECQAFEELYKSYKNVGAEKM